MADKHEAYSMEEYFALTEYRLLGTVSCDFIRVGEEIVKTGGGLWV